MQKKQDIMWEQSTLWESVEKWVTKYLKKSHSEYRELQVKAMRIVDENPALRILINSMEGRETKGTGKVVFLLSLWRAGFPRT